MFLWNFGSSWYPCTQMRNMPCKPFRSLSLQCASIEQSTAVSWPSASTISNSQPQKFSCSVSFIQVQSHAPSSLPSWARCRARRIFVERRMLPCTQNDERSQEGRTRPKCAVTAWEYFPPLTARRAADIKVLAIPALGCFERTLSILLLFLQAAANLERGDVVPV